MTILVLYTTLSGIKHNIEANVMFGDDIMLRTLTSEKLAVILTRRLET